MSNDSVKKTMIVAVGVCLVCSILVSTAAVSLNKKQTENKKLDKIKNILIASGFDGDHVDIKKTFHDKFEPAIIDLKNGEPIPESKYDDILNTEDFDIKKVAASSQYGESIPADMDLARINRMPKDMLVYFKKNHGKIEQIILPIYGKGLWSTLYGFLALDNDLKTIHGITFYEHGETPGLGGEIDNPRWKKIWKGKLAFDDNLDLKIQVIKGKVDKSRPDGVYKVDGLSGATLTTRGVNNLVRFWLGEHGYGPFLVKLREGDSNG